MATRGRKPAPTEVKRLRGERKSRLNGAEPDAPDVARIRPPEHLKGSARAEYLRLGRVLGAIRVLKTPDLAALELYAVSYSRWREAEDRLAQEGLTITTKRGPMINPMVKVAREHREQCLRFLAEFGCTPSSRNRVRSEKEAPRDRFAEFMARKDS